MSYSNNQTHLLNEEINKILEEALSHSNNGRALRIEFEPITALLYKNEKNLDNKLTLKSIFKIFKIIVILITSILLVSCCFYESSDIKSKLKFHGLAIIRIALIKVLPVWNWTDIYYSKCLVKNPFYEDPEIKFDDCNLCETLDDIEKLSQVTQRMVLEDYIKRERPLIVTDAMSDWPIMMTNQFWFDNVTELYLDEDNKYRACSIKTNLRMGQYDDLSRVLKKLYSPYNEQWFLHWENCQKDGAKAARSFYKRPYFISNSLDFTGSNWVLMSSDFKGRVYKTLETRDTLSMLYQIRGGNHIRLTPRETCRAHCPELTFTLYEGEILVITNMLWILEYIPKENEDNFGIVSEVSLPSLD